jgi:hypothetical protein
MEWLGARELEGIVPAGEKANDPTRNTDRGNKEGNWVTFTIFLNSFSLAPVNHDSSV